MSHLRWRAVAALSGPRSWAVTLALLALGIAWLSWPVWSSSTTPDLETQRALLWPLLGAWVGLLILLAWALWRDGGRSSTVFAPVGWLVALAVVVRALLSPGASGVELTLAIPLLAGAALGGPAGFLTGATACLVSSAMFGLIAEPLVVQTLVWGLWGLAGSLVRGASTRVAWLVLVVLALLLGPVSGVALNTIGWASDTGAPRGAFLLGAGPWESWTRLLDYTIATSLPLDTVRGLTSGAVVLLVGHPLLRGLRRAFDDPPPPPSRPRSRISDDDLARRRRSDALTNLWNPSQGAHR